MVYISLVNSAHAIWTEKALESGRHVLVDKPSFLNFGDAERLIELAERKNRCLAEAVIFGDHPLIRDGLRILAQHGAGTHVNAILSVPPFPDSDFRYRADLGGGALNDIGPYAAATSRLFFGDPPMDLFCRVGTRQPGTGLPLSFSMLADYGGERSLTGIFGFDMEYLNRITVIGPRILMEFPRPYTLPPELETELVVCVGNEDVSRVIEPADSFTAFMGRLKQAITKKDHGHLHQDLLRDARFRTQLSNAARCT